MANYISHITQKNAGITSLVVLKEDEVEQNNSSDISESEDGIMIVTKLAVMIKEQQAWSCLE